MLTANEFACAMYREIDGYEGWRVFRTMEAARQAVENPDPTQWPLVNGAKYTGEIFTEREMIEKGLFTPDENPDDAQ